MSMIKRLLPATERKHDYFQDVRKDNTCFVFHMIIPEQMDES